MGKKLLGRHALGGDFCRFVFVRFSPKKKQMRKTWGTNKTGRKSRLPTVVLVYLRADLDSIEVDAKIEMVPIYLGHTIL